MHIFITFAWGSFVDHRLDPSSYQLLESSTSSPHPVGPSMALSSVPPQRSGPLGGFGTVPGGT